jgi:hypothetical protein
MGKQWGRREPKHNGRLQTNKLALVIRMKIYGRIVIQHEERREYVGGIRKNTYNSKRKNKK